MREIKFRGKRIDNGEWVQGYFLVAAGMPFISAFGERSPILVIPETVGQYTGLKDKNGKEIYEGDVVGFNDCSYTESGYYEQSCIGVVVWGNETASFEVSNRLSADSYEVLNECVVIGNIHDNPDLEESK